MKRNRILIIVINIINVVIFFLPWVFVNMGNVLGRINFSFYRMITTIDKFTSILKTQQVELSLLDMGWISYLLLIFPILSIVAIVVDLLRGFDKKAMSLQKITFIFYIMLSILTIIINFAIIKNYTNNVRLGYGVLVSLILSGLGLVISSRKYIKY